MTTLTLPAYRLQTGDVLVAVVLGDQVRELPERRVIEGTHRGDGAVRMVRPGPNPHDVEWWIYPDQADAWQVERITEDEVCTSCRARRGEYRREGGAAWLCAPCESQAGVEYARRPLRLGALDEDTRERVVAALAVAVPKLPAHLALTDRADGTVAEVGDVVLIASGVYWRAGVVIAAGPKRLRVEYTTPTGVAHDVAGRYGRSFAPWCTRAAARVVRPGEWWTNRAAKIAAAGT